MMVGAILAALRRIAIMIGRWIIRRMADYGITKLIHYMEGRIDVFRDRMAAGIAKRFNRGRIRRWIAVIKWILSNRKQLTCAAARKYNAILEAAGVPDVSPRETCPA